MGKNRCWMVFLCAFTCLVMTYLFLSSESLEGNTDTVRVGRFPGSQGHRSSSFSSMELTTNKSPLPRQQLAQLSFVSLGDWGIANQDQSYVAKALAQHVQSNFNSFMLSAGDMIYPQGAKSPDDPKFQEIFTNVFSDKALQFPWIMTLGNHDCVLPTEDTYIPFAAKQDNPWIMPARYYFVDVPLAASESNESILQQNLSEYHVRINGVKSKQEAGPEPNFWLRIIVIDTCSLKCEIPEPINEYEERQCKMTQKMLINGSRQKQLEWLNKIVDDADRNPQIVLNLFLGHTSVYSTGKHHNSLLLHRLLQPVFAMSNKSQILLAGHEHSLQYWQIHKNLIPKPYSGFDAEIDKEQNSGGNFRGSSHRSKTKVDIHWTSDSSPSDDGGNSNRTSSGTKLDRGQCLSQSRDGKVIHQFINGGGGGHIHGFLDDYSPKSRVRRLFYQRSFGFMDFHVSVHSVTFQSSDSKKDSRPENTSYHTLADKIAKLRQGLSSTIDHSLEVRIEASFIAPDHTTLYQTCWSYSLKS